MTSIIRNTLTRSRKTPKQVKDDLDKMLLNDALKHLRPEPDPSDRRQSVERRLEVILARFAQRQFPDKPPPPDLVGKRLRITKFLYYGDPVSLVDDIPTFTNELHKEIKFPYWMKAAAKSHVATFVKSLLSRETGNAFQLAEDKKIFDPSTENDTTIKSSTNVIYVNGSLSEDEAEANVSCLCVVSDIYQVKSERKATTDTIRQESYSRLKELAPQDRNIETDEQLAQALSHHGRTLFRKKFDFDYKATPRHRSQFNTVSMITSHDQLCYIPEIESQNRDALLERELFSGVNIPDGEVKDQVVGDITQQIVYLTGLQKGQWGVLYLDKSYTFADPSRPSLRGAAVLLFYHDSKTSANGISLTGTYFYLLLMLYEATPVTAMIIGDLLQTLFSDVRQKITNFDGPNVVRDMEPLKAALFRYGKQRFQEEFHFAFDGDNTKPPNALGRVTGCARLLDFGHFPPSPQIIGERIGVELFQPDGFEFSDASVQKEIHRTLTSATEALTRGFSLDNAWLSSKNEKSFRMSSNSELLLKGYTMFVYALGSRSAGNVKVERVFIYVITVYCAIKNKTESPWPDLE